MNYIESNSNDHNGVSETIIKIRLYDGTWVDERLYKAALRHVRKALPTLEHGGSYTAKRLCTKEFWNQLEKCDRLLAGKCLVDMALKELLSLDPAGKTGANSRLYQLK